MEEKEKFLSNTCSFVNVKPIMMDLPYPPTQVREKNPMHANLLSMDYCGSVSEMSAVTQYINNENRLSCEKCSLAKTILGIAMAEMIHLQKLGELIFLLGGSIDFIARQNNGRRRMWTPEYLVIPTDASKMLIADIESEKSAIQQYRMHIKMIQDDQVNSVLARIIQDEEYHIMLLQMLLKEL
ncbi:MAG: ferritin family protein [Eubacteriales bacterium]|nr:ferritin family protein [Eubacteriales bacterium]